MERRDIYEDCSAQLSLKVYVLVRNAIVSVQNSSGHKFLILPIFMQSYRYTYKDQCYSDLINKIQKIEN